MTHIVYFQSKQVTRILRVICKEQFWTRYQYIYNILANINNII